MSQRIMLTSEQVDWYEDYWYPFVNRWAARVRDIVGPDKLVFVEAIPNEV